MVLQYMYKIQYKIKDKYEKAIDVMNMIKGSIKSLKEKIETCMKEAIQSYFIFSHCTVVFSFK